MERTYIAIDLKSFYASVECRDRGLDPLTTSLVVADASRTEKTICLAVSPSLKAYGIPGRARLFEVVQKVREVNRKRLSQAPDGKFSGKSTDAQTLDRDPAKELDFIAAKPRMARYMEVSSAIYQIYLGFIAAEDIHVYSIDEVIMDATSYLRAYGKSPEELTRDMIRAVLKETGITATAGIGTNMYLAKVAMDIVAKHIPADENGVRIAKLDEISYRERLWTHRPLTDFWRVGRGYRRKLEENGLFTMGDIARCSLGGNSDYQNEDLLYRLFGVNAELLIDHAWGCEPCTMEAIKSYKPRSSSMGGGQVLSRPYEFQQARLVFREMADGLALDLVDKHVLTDQLVATVCYDIENLSDPERAKLYHGPLKKDFYGRTVPKDAHGSLSLGEYTSSAHLILDKATDWFDRTVDRDLLIRRIYLTAERLLSPEEAASKREWEQMDLFTDYDALEKQKGEKQAADEKERKMQEAQLAIKRRYGKNACVKGMNLEEGATAMERNGQIGGHRA